MKVIKTPEDYEKAKAALCQEQEEGYSGDDIAAVMLNYRRQHNIYEVGDKVVYRNLPHERLFSVRYVGDDEIVVYELWDEMGAKTFTENYPYSDIDHANDAEIEAGHRIEIDQSGLEELSMYDIGPNVIVIDK